MKFNNEALSQTATPDPLWLHKVGTSLINKEAMKRAQQSGDTLELETHVVLNDIENCLKHPDWISNTKTGFEPLIDKVTEEALALNRIYDFFFSHEHRSASELAKSSNRLRERIASEILGIYSNTSALLHMHRTSQITNDELQIGAALEVQKLNRYGTNGLAALSHAWPNRDLFTELQESPKKFIPKRLRGWSNTSNESISRKDYFEKELKRETPASEEAKAKFLEEIMPELFGPEYEAAWKAKEALLGQHITSGTIKFDPHWTPIAALHRHNEEAQKKAIIKGTTPAFEHTDPALNASEETLKRISQDAHPTSFLEILDSSFSKLHPEQGKIAKDLRAAIATLRGHEALPDLSSTEQEAHQHLKEEISPAGNPSKAGSVEEPAIIESTENLASKIHSGKALAIKGGVALLGGIVIADQFRRTHRKDADQSNEQKISKITNYIIATAATVGTCLVIFTKPEKLIRFADNVFEFLGKSTSRG